ncbi:MAG: carbamoyltransferase HypF [Anaerolineae bacterium]
MTIDSVETQERVARHITITGVVQGVGFRPFVYNLASERGLSGWVLNHSGGVDIEVEGPEEDVKAFVVDLEAKAPPIATIESLVAQPIALQGYEAFEIRHSESQAGRYQLISPDVATCDDCLRELFDPDDRRYRYPFINCTNCGPRFTIIEDIPYDRPKTTMRVFPMCEDCRAEYEDPRDRRFHAQPNACPVCGPQVWLVEANGRMGDRANPQITNHKSHVNGWPEGQREETGIQPAATGDAALIRTAELLRSGRILAIKGLGGFHLACDATNPEAVALLRERKRRPHKPFAIMVATVDDVRDLCEVPPEAEALLTSPRCPIVLLESRPEAAVADGIAPNSHTLGVMIPYTPLHHILLRDVGRPLVMTSGNVTEEPIAKDNDEALRRLAPLADAFLLHNRDIHARYDDSVVQVARQLSAVSSQSGEDDKGEGLGDTETGVEDVFVQPIRRARGYAPFPIRLPFGGPQVFAAGPLLKNTFTLTRDDYAFVSQHIGDLESLETLEHYQEALKTYQQLFRVEPERVARDLHPDYMSTRLAEAYARDHNLPTPYRIQHHHAHIASVLAESGRGPEAGPVIGVALDGTGYGEDGHIWGGEWFVGDLHGFERVAHLEYMPLPGGDAAIRQPWRIAVAYLHALDADERLPLGEFCPADVMRVRTMVDRQLNTPLTSSTGRLFDAVSALLGVCHHATYEAQAAIELEQAVGRTSRLSPDAWRRAMVPYPFEIDGAAYPYRLCVGSLFDAILSDVERGLSVADISLRFHGTVAAMVDLVCRRLREETGIATVALSGGVFQNGLLMALVLPRLRAAGFEVLRHQQLPPNDGCISLGQAAMAALA